MSSDYQGFLNLKSQLSSKDGFRASFLPGSMFDFQSLVTAWAIEEGRAAIFADCGLGKSLMELVFAENVVRHTNRPVLVLAPLGVTTQIVNEADRFGIEAKRSRDGTVHKNITVTNYDRLHYFNPNDFAGVVCDESSVLKAMKGVRRREITDFMRKVQGGTILQTGQRFAIGALWDCGRKIETPEEIDLFNAVGLAWIEPEDRC